MAAIRRTLSTVLGQTGELGQTVAAVARVNVLRRYEEDESNESFRKVAQPDGFLFLGPRTAATQGKEADGRAKN